MKNMLSQSEKLNACTASLSVTCCSDHRKNELMYTSQVERSCKHSDFSIECPRKITASPLSPGARRIPARRIPGRPGPKNEVREKTRPVRAAQSRHGPSLDQVRARALACGSARALTHPAHVHIRTHACTATPRCARHHAHPLCWSVLIS